MGIFDWLNRKKDSSMTEGGCKSKWDFYLTNIDNKAGSIMVDLGLVSIAPIASKEKLIWVTVKMNNPKENGLSKSEELNTLSEIENLLVDTLFKTHNSVFAGRTTTDGNRDFYFYSHDINLYEKSISEVMLKFHNYNYDCGSREDKEWRSYLEYLYPTPNQLQSIQNRNIVEQLEKNGDKLIKPRQVFHWIYFKSVNDRKLFINRIHTENFKIESEEYDKSMGEFSYRLQISRVEKVDYDNVDEYCLYLWELAKEYNGDYDGWETSIEKD